jgi:hypothetical protein
MNTTMNHEDRIVADDQLDAIIDQFDGDDMAIDLADGWSDDAFDGDDDDDRLSGGIGDDFLSCEA